MSCLLNWENLLSFSIEKILLPLIVRILYKYVYTFVGINSIKMLCPLRFSWMFVFYFAPLKNINAFEECLLKSIVYYFTYDHFNRVSLVYEQISLTNSHNNEKIDITERCTFHIYKNWHILISFAVEYDRLYYTMQNCIG